MMKKVFLNPYARLTTNHQSIYIYIYIYKQRSHVGKHEVLPCSALYEDSFFFFLETYEEILNTLKPH